MPATNLILKVNPNAHSIYFYFLVGTIYISLIYGVKVHKKHIFLEVYYVECWHALKFLIKLNNMLSIKNI